jgi:hypothetical protein
MLVIEQYAVNNQIVVPVWLVRGPINLELTPLSPITRSHGLIYTRSYAIAANPRWSLQNRPMERARLGSEEQTGVKSF